MNLIDQIHPLFNCHCNRLQKRNSSFIDLFTMYHTNTINCDSELNRWIALFTKYLAIFDFTNNLKLIKNIRNINKI